VVPLSGCHASLVILVIVSPFPSKHNKCNSHEHLFSASFLLLTLFINSSNAIVGFVGNFMSTSFFFGQLQLDSTRELFVCLFVGMFLSASFFFLALPFLLIGFLDSWIYLSAACLLDYNPTEVGLLCLPFRWSLEICRGVPCTNWEPLRWSRNACLWACNTFCSS
jgi:hypothetical protein